MLGVNELIGFGAGGVNLLRTDDQSTSGAFSFTPPSGTQYAIAELWAGGGGGDADGGIAGYSGGGGGYSLKRINSPSTLSGSVGAGGIASTNGVYSYLTGHHTAYGGGRGGPSSPGIGGSATGGDVNISGTNSSLTKGGAPGTASGFGVLETGSGSYGAPSPLDANAGRVRIKWYG